MHMFTPQQPAQDLNPGPSDLEAHTICVSPTNEDSLRLVLIDKQLAQYLA